MTSIEESGQTALDQLIARVRETVGVNRIALFLDCDHPSLAADFSGRGLLCVGAIGIPSNNHERCRLSMGAGIAKWVTRHGRILSRRDAGRYFTPSENMDVENEFAILDCEIAIPISDGENTIGIAFLGPPVTGSRFSDADLQRSFHLMEKFGLFMRNFRRQEELIRDNRLLNQVLSIIKCGTLVVNDDLIVLKANPAVKDFLGRKSTEALTFDDIPAALSDQIRGTITEHEAPPPTFLTLPGDPQKRLFRITLHPLVEEEDPFRLLIVVVEDYSEVETARETAVAAAVSRLTRQLQFLGNSWSD